MVALAQESHTGNAPDGFPISPENFAKGLDIPRGESLTTIATLEQDIRRNNADRVVEHQLEHTRRLYEMPVSDFNHEGSEDYEQTHTAEMIRLLDANKALFEQGIDTYEELFDEAERFLEGVRDMSALVAAKYLALQELTYNDFLLADGYTARYELEKDPVAYLKGLSGDTNDAFEVDEAEVATYKKRTQRSIQEALQGYNASVKALSYIDGFATTTKPDTGIIA